MKKSSPKFVCSLLAAAAVMAGCEWTGTSDSGSWSGNYDALNFSGTYRASAVQTSSSETTSTDTSGDNGEKKFKTTKESAGAFAAGSTTAAGTLSHGNVVPGSVQVSAGGKYIWTDNGSRTLVLGGGSSAGTSATTTTSRVPNEDQGSFPTARAVWSGHLNQKDITPGSVQIKAGSYTWMDDGSGNLVCSATGAGGSILYSSGAWSIDITNMQRAYQQIGSSVSVSATYSYVSTSGTTIEGVSGSGTILYESGSWSVSISPAMSSGQSITISYSYYEENSSSTSTSTSSSSSGWANATAVSAATVQHTGQNLTITLNNGIVMVGKFTSVTQTGKIDEDTGAGANTFNAQFQVASGKESKMVGNLFYDYATHNRILDATWTWGRNTYDVHGTGPAWTESGITTYNTTGE